MPGVVPVFKHLQPTYPLNTGVSILGGQVVSADTSVAGVSAVKPCSAGDFTTLGVAITDATGTPNTGTPITTAYLPAVTAVASSCIIPVTYTSAATFGQKLKAGAAGSVAAWVHGTDTDTSLIIGESRSMSGAVASGAVDLALIY